ncbi:MAG: FAD-dependent oxidoreductase [Opitutales bacterium]
MSDDQTFDVIVVGAGAGGISAALTAARGGAKTLLLEAGDEVGGTGVHARVGCCCSWFDKSGRYINDGVHREFFPQCYEPGATDRIATYDEDELLKTYRSLLAGEANILLRTHTRVTAVRTNSRRIESIEAEGAEIGTFRAETYIDSTANGNLAAMAGAAFEKGRTGDGAMQPASLMFSVSGIDLSKCHVELPHGTITTWTEAKAVCSELTTIYHELQRTGGTNNPKESVLLTPYPNDPTRALFNQTRVTGVDPTDPGSVERARAEGEQQVREFFEAIQAQHPAFADAQIDKISAQLGVREGRRIIGDYMLTEQDCLGEARYDDMVAAGAYAMDIHNPDGKGTRLVGIPGSGYYHIPYRCLIARDFDNLLLGSRCISGTHEAHSSYRVISSITSIGMAAGAAACLTSTRDRSDVRQTPATEIRALLAAQGQFVEEPTDGA